MNQAITITCLECNIDFPINEDNFEIIINHFKMHGDLGVPIQPRLQGINLNQEPLPNWPQNIMNLLNRNEN